MLSWQFPHVSSIQSYYMLQTLGASAKQLIHLNLCSWNDSIKRFLPTLEAAVSKLSIQGWLQKTPEHKTTWCKSSACWLQATTNSWNPNKQLRDHMGANKPSPSGSSPFTDDQHSCINLATRPAVYSRPVSPHRVKDVTSCGLAGLPLPAPHRPTTMYYKHNAG